MNTKLLKTMPPFRDLFPINEKILEAIYWDMQKNGYDRSQPIIVWESHDSIVIDGHTRLRAALKAGIDEVPVMLKPFKDESAALEYAIKCQKNRRNLKDFEIMNCIQELDKRMTKSEAGSNHGKLAPFGASSGKTADQTATLLGISPRKVERTRTVMDHASEEIKEAVRSGKMSIHAACQKTTNKDRSKPRFAPLTREEQSAIAEVLTFAEERLSERLFDAFEKVLTQMLTSRDNEPSQPSTEGV